MIDMTPREAVEVLRDEALGWNWLDADAPEDVRKHIVEAIATLSALSALADRAGEPVWIVNDLGELGVDVGGRQFFLYKGENIEYDGTHDDGTPMLYREVGKREFGEVCWPAAWWRAGRREDRYTVELEYVQGLSDGQPGDMRYQWRALPPAAPGASHDR